MRANSRRPPLKETPHPNSSGLSLCACHCTGTSLTPPRLHASLRSALPLQPGGSSNPNHPHHPTVTNASNPSPVLVIYIRYTPHSVRDRAPPIPPPGTASPPRNERPYPLRDHPPLRIPSPVPPSSSSSTTSYATIPRNPAVKSGPTAVVPPASQNRTMPHATPLSVHSHSLRTTYWTVLFRTHSANVLPFTAKPYRTVRTVQ